MNTILYVTFFTAIALFLINLWFLFMRKQSKNFAGMFTNWKVSSFLLIIFLLAYFIFFVSATQTINQKQTYDFNDGSPSITVSGTDYLEAFSYLNLLNIILFLNTGITAANILMEFQVFGRGRFKRNRD